jgi:integrase
MVVCRLYKIHGPRYLTPDFVESAVVEPGKRRTIYWDKNFRTFGLFVSDTGHKSYVLQYRDRNTRQQSRVTFKCEVGEKAKIGLKEAKHLAKEALLRIQVGGKPLVEIGAKARQGQTFKAVADEYLKVLRTRVTNGELRQSSLDAIERQLIGKERTKKVHWKPLHSLNIASIDRATVAARLRKIADQHGPGAADQSRANLSTLFAWTIGEGICDANPVEGTNRQSEGKERERSLIQTGEKPSYDDLIAVWKGTPDDEDGKIIRLLILTMCRRDEIGSLKWSEIDREARLIRFPGTRTKNGQEHVVPLSAPAMAIIDTVERRKDRDLLFGSGKGGYSGWSKAKERLDNLVPIKTPWVLHDLRRSGRKGLGILGIAPHIAEAVLNHLPPKLMRTYDRNRYEKEKREALNLWAAHLMGLVSGKEI